VYGIWKAIALQHIYEPMNDYENMLEMGHVMVALGFI
jgi:hypothetical protein